MTNCGRMTTRSPSLARRKRVERQRDPDLVRHFGRQAMEGEGREKTEHGIWRAHGNDEEIAMRRPGCRRREVDAAARALHVAVGNEAPESLARNAVPRQIARPGDGLT